MKYNRNWLIGAMLGIACTGLFALTAPAQIFDTARSERADNASRAGQGVCQGEWSALTHGQSRDVGVSEYENRVCLDSAPE